MGAYIQGHSGRTADVTKDRLNVVNEEPFVTAARNGDAYAWNWSYNSGANETTVAVKNDDQNRVLVITGLVVSSDAAGEWIFHFCDLCTTGTGVTGTNLNRDSNKAALASAYENETGNTLASGADIISFAVEADKTETFNLPSIGVSIRLGYGDSVGLDNVAAATALTYGAVIGYYE